MLTELLDVTYPPHCCVCGNAIDRTLSDNCCSLLCSSCLPRTADEFLIGRQNQDSDNCGQKYCPHCQEPYSPGLGTSARCLHCSLVPPPWNRLRSLWPYRDHLEEIIKAYKYGNRWSLGKQLATSLASFVQRVYPDCTWDAIVPVPSSLAALRNRGFSPTAVVSKALSRQIGIPCETRFLSSSRKHTPQASLRYVQRWENAQHSFAAPSPHVTGKRLLLIDDVVTTGSTLFAAAAALRTAGALHIDAVTLARSQHFRQSRFLLLDRQLAQLKTMAASFTN